MSNWIESSILAFDRSCLDHVRVCPGMAPCGDAGSVRARPELKVLQTLGAPRRMAQADPERSWGTAYSITLSALPSSNGGMVTPSALAVLRLITSSNLVGCCTGSSVGFAPLRIFPV